MNLETVQVVLSKGGAVKGIFISLAKAQEIVSVFGGYIEETHIYTDLIWPEDDTNDK